MHYCLDGWVYALVDRWMKWCVDRCIYVSHSDRNVKNLGGKTTIIYTHTRCYLSSCIKLFDNCSLKCIKLSKLSLFYSEI